MIKEDNAAGRLWTLLKDVREEVRGERNTVVEAWATVLGFNQASDLQRHTAMVGAYALLADVHAEIQSLSGRFDTERYSSYFEQWGKPFEVASQVVFVSPDNLISQAAMDVLASLADVLHGLGVRSGAGNAARASADELLTEVAAVIEQVLAQDELDGDFRAFLLEHLREVEGALRRFRLRGYREIDEVVGKINGDAVRAPGRWSAFVEHPVWRSFIVILDRLAVLRRGSQDLTQIGENAKRLLELTGGGS